MVVTGVALAAVGAVAYLGVPQLMAGGGGQAVNLHSGEATNLHRAVTDEPESLWSRSLATADALVVDDTLVVIDEDRWELSALSVDDGSTRWSAGLPRSTDDGYAHMTEDDGRILARTESASGDGVTILEVYDADTGELLWSVRDVYVQGVEADLVVVLREGEVIALDASTGDQRWQQPTVGMLEVHANTVYVVGEGFVEALELDSGELRWRSRLMLDDEAYVNTSVATSSGLVLADGTGRVTALDEGTGEETWAKTYRAEYGVSLSPIGGDRLAVSLPDEAEAVLVDAATGKEYARSATTAWTSASFELAEGRVLAIGEDVTLLDPESGQVLSTMRLPGEYRSGTALGDGILYVRTVSGDEADGEIVAVDLATMRPRWTMPDDDPGGRILTADGKLVVTGVESIRVLG